MTEFRPGSFQILPVIIKNLIIINVLVFAAQNVISPTSGFSMENTFALHTWQSQLFKPWQFVTYLFLHGDIMHIFFNMLALWMFGSTLENLWGPKRFLIFYLACGLGAALCHMTVLYVENQNLINDFSTWSPQDQMDNLAALRAHLNSPTLGASGAVFGCLAAFGYMFPNDYMYVYFFPVKVKWFVLIYAGTELLSALKNTAGDNVAHVAHLGGALVGFIMVYFWKKNNRRNLY